MSKEIEDKHIHVTTMRPLPQEIIEKYQEAKKEQYVTLGFLALSAFIVASLASGSQAMRAFWIEDLLSSAPVIVFLVTSQFLTKEPTPNFPFGYERLKALGFLISASALFFFGALLLYESFLALLHMKKPSIGAMEVFNFIIWKGWLMIAALILISIPCFFLAKRKFALARELNDETLYADGKVLKADCLSGLAAALGLFGVAFGYWWSDSLAALFISFEILKDGFQQLRVAGKEIADHTPVELGGKGRDPLLAEVVKKLNSYDVHPTLRLRSMGPRLSGQIFIVNKKGIDLEKLEKEVVGMSWRIAQIDIIEKSGS